MGLCWSNNTHYWGKDKFPYKESAPLSSRLWMKVAGVRVVLTVVYSEPEPDDELIAYKVWSLILFCFNPASITQFRNSAVRLAHPAAYRASG